MTTASATPPETPATRNGTVVVIERSRGLLRVPWRELWEYRDLFRQFVRRDFAAKYRQTMLGPLWFILQPLMMTAVFTVVFGRVAQLPTDNVPPVLFYMCGLLAWSYFAQTMPSIAGTFTTNQHLFSKIYFPRLTIPLSVMTTNLVALGLQLVTFTAMWLYYRTLTGFAEQPHTGILLALGLFLLAQVQIMILALGVGSLFAAATGKYRDLQHVLPVVVQIWFYATPVVYPLSMISVEARWRWVTVLNPMTAPVEAMKLALVGNSSWTPTLALGAWTTTLVILLIGLAAFSRAERTVVDVA
jgi:lipopolysaccharide transport system permease protein